MPGVRVLLSRWIWVAWAVLLSLFAVAVVAPELGNYPVVSGNDGWIMSASYKLANDGVFGSDLYAGFYNAEQVYFIALPVHHVLQALAFRIAGVGMFEARVVALLGGLVVLWCVAWLGYRWYGSFVSVIAVLLLLFWRAGLLDAGSGLPWLDTSRWGRYDMTAVAFLWLTIVLLDRQLRRPGIWLATAVGFTAGLATLSQFFGIFVLPIIAGALLWDKYRPAGAREYSIWRSSLWMLFGWLVVILPYLFYIARHPKEFAGQAELKEGRTDFYLPSFYINNLLDELDRYRPLLEKGIPGLTASYDPSFHPAGPVVLAVAIVPAIVYLGYRIRRFGTVGDRLLSLSLVTLAVSLALFDSTNNSLYAIVLFPAIVLTVALGWTAAIRWAAHGISRRSFQRHDPRRLADSLARIAASVVLVVLLGGVVAEGAEIYRLDRNYASTIADYRDEFGAEIESYLEPGATVIGPDFAWWALADHPYRSINSVFLLWQSDVEDGTLSSFVPVVESNRAGYILFGGEAWEDLEHMPAEQEEPIRAFLFHCTEHIGTIDSPGYDRIMVFEVLPDDPTRPECRA